MPIRAEYRPLYGAEWRAYRLELIARRGQFCTRCRRVVLRYLNLAHLTHDPYSSEVALLCAACHNRHDSRHRYAVWRRNRARRVGQGWLLPEIEDEAYVAPPVQEALFA